MLNITLDQARALLEGEAQQLFDQASKELDALIQLNSRGAKASGEQAQQTYSMARNALVLAACVAHQKTLAELLEGLTLFPQTLINVRLQPGFDWQSHAPLQQAQREATRKMVKKSPALRAAPPIRPPSTSG